MPLLRTNLPRVFLFLIAAACAAVWWGWSDDDAGRLPSPVVEGPQVAARDARPEPEADPDTNTSTPVGLRAEVDPNAQAPTDAGVITGRVVSLAATPIAGARVLVVRGRPLFKAEWFRDPLATPRARIGDGGIVEVTTGADGRFRAVPAFAEQSVDVIAVARGHVANRVAAPATAGLEVDVGLVILSPGILVEGRVVDTNGRPVEGAAVGRIESNRSGREIRYIDDEDPRTDADGAFRWLFEQVGEFEFAVDHPAHAPARFEGTVQLAGDREPIEIRLAAPVVTRGDVVDRPRELAESGVFEVVAHPRGTRYGRIRLAKFRRSLIGVRRAKVSRDGVFSMHGLQADKTYEFMVTWTARDGSRVVEFARGRAKGGAQDVRLVGREPVSVRFRVVAKGTGRAVTRVGAFEEFRSKQPNGRPPDPRSAIGAPPFDDLRAGADGTFRIGPLYPRESRAKLSLTLRKTGFLTKTRSKFTLPASGELDLGVLELEPRPVLRVEVRDSVGAPVAGARVRVRETETAPPPGTSISVQIDSAVEWVLQSLRPVTDASGVCEITIEEGARQDVGVWHREFANWMREGVEVPERGTCTLSVTLESGGSVRVRVVDGDGVGSAAARVACQAIEGRGGRTHAETDAAGVVLFEHLPVGMYRVWLAGQDGRRAPPPSNATSVRISGEEPTEITLTR